MNEERDRARPPMLIDSRSTEVATSHRGRSRLDTAPVRVIVLSVLFTAAAIHEATHFDSLTGTDIWWHLRTGFWILQNHAAPHSGLFTQYSNLPWVASSWGFDVIAAAAYKLLGLRSLPALVIGCRIALAALIFLLARGARGNFWTAVLLAAAGQYAIPGLSSQACFCSILLFAVELELLLHSRRSGSVRRLYWLPPLFVLWANLHIQFLYGLLALALFLAAVLGEQVFRRQGYIGEGHPALGSAQVAAVVGASCLATLLTPYSYHTYALALSNASSRAQYVFTELDSIRFRQPQDYVVLLLAMAAFLMLGHQRSQDLFKVGLMTVCVMFAFRFQRDTWFVVLPSIAVIADALSSVQSEAFQQKALPAWKQPVIAGLVLAVVASSIVLGICSKQEALLNKIGKSFPLRACDFIRQNHLPAPLFNDYRWGGFLAWYLPEYPVAIDDRFDLYGDDMTDRYFKLIEGRLPLTDPIFASASTILLDKKSGMGVFLSRSSDFEVAYGDDLATVLVRRH